MRLAKTGLVYGEVYLQHETGRHHPEKPQRLTAIIETLEAAGLLDKLVRVEPVPAEKSVLELCHTSRYIDEFKSAVDHSDPFLHTPECILSPATFEVALCAVGGVLRGIDKVMEGTVRNCFCAVRPPGHHAESYKAMGFCFFNNGAISARYIQQQYGMSITATAPNTCSIRIQLYISQASTKTLPPATPAREGDQKQDMVRGKDLPKTSPCLRVQEKKNI